CRARSAVDPVLRRAHRRRGRAGGGRRAPGVRAGVMATTHADALRGRLRATPTVGVIGLGYVGLPLAVAFADSGARVIGVDLDAQGVAAIRPGRSFIVAVHTPT